MKRKGFTLIELMIVIAIIAIIAAIAIPSILAATRAANERNASGSLKQFSSIEITFKTSDSDGNKINDYWVTDVAGLYYVTPTASAQIRMIEISVCLADGNTVPASWITAPLAPHNSNPKAGYWYQALINFEDYNGTTYVPVTYASTNVDRFGFIAYPNSYGSSGKLVFIINEGGTMFKKDPAAGGNVVSTAPATGSTDTGAVLNTTIHYDTFPYDPNVSTSANAPGPWSKMD